MRDWWRRPVPSLTLREKRFRDLLLWFAATGACDVLLKDTRIWWLGVFPGLMMFRAGWRYLVALSRDRPKR